MRDCRPPGAGEAAAPLIRTHHGHLGHLCLDPPEVAVSNLDTEAVSLGPCLAHLNPSLVGTLSSTEQSPLQAHASAGTRSWTAALGQRTPPTGRVRKLPETRSDTSVGLRRLQRTSRNVGIAWARAFP